MNMTDSMNFEDAIEEDNAEIIWVHPTRPQNTCPIKYPKVTEQESPAETSGEENKKVIGKEESIEVDLTHTLRGAE